jgi:hypothetical protein
MEDIEDLAALASEPREGRGTVAVFRRRKKKEKAEPRLLDDGEHHADDDTTRVNSTGKDRDDFCVDKRRHDDGSNMPGRGSVYIKTWGCTHNGSDGEYMAGLLSNYGFNIVGECFSGCSL